MAKHFGWMRGHGANKIAGLLLALGMVFGLVSCGPWGKQAYSSPLTGAVSRQAVMVTPTPWFQEPTQTATKTARQTATQAAPPAQKGVNPSSSQAEALKTPTPETVGLSPIEARSAVLSALSSVRQAGPYRVISTVTTEGGASVQSTSEVILPDRFHLFSNEQETLVVGSKTYVLQNGKWVLFPADMSRILSGMIGADKSEYGLSGFQWVSADKIDGASATIYQFTSTRQVEGAPHEASVKIWIDLGTGLPVRQEIEESRSADRSHTVQVIQYDSSIRIEEP